MRSSLPLDAFLCSHILGTPSRLNGIRCRRPPCYYTLPFHYWFAYIIQGEYNGWICNPAQYLELVAFLDARTCNQSYGCTLARAKCPGGELTLRLFGGPSVLEGRLEVYYDGQWGTICDDNWVDSYCQLVCDQLGFTDGSLVSASAYGACASEIWLDDVKCHGHETSLDQCDRGFWGNHNCDHDEDVACVCGSLVPVSGSCDTIRHQLTPIDRSVPWIGRVEVQDEAGQWGTVCDDNWRDSEAHVFCTCLGFSNPEFFRAYWSTELADLAPSLPMHYDNVTCNSAACATTHNLWECETHESTGRCDVISETAGVACGPLPVTITPTAPTVDLTCDSNTMTVCFVSTDYAMNANYLSLLPGCALARAYNITNGVCYDVDMNTCPAGLAQSDSTSKHYCYDVTYSQYDSDPATLLTDSVWSRQACCSVAKNGSVASSFGSHIIQSSEAVYASTPTDFALTCYTDSSFTGSPLVFPANVTRGQELYCRVTAHAWDDSLFLVVPECEFRAFPVGPPSYQFLFDKCPTTGELQVSYYNFDSHNWGLQFQTPKFQGYDSLYMSCTAYVCDAELDDKPYCDRSCTSHNQRRRRDVSVHHAYAHGARDHVVRGAFLIQDEGFGPLIHVASSLSNIQPPGPSISHVENYAFEPYATSSFEPYASSGNRPDTALGRTWAITSIMVFIMIFNIFIK